jgi:hypothetical protein
MFREVNTDGMVTEMMIMPNDCHRETLRSLNTIIPNRFALTGGGWIWVADCFLTPTKA